MVTVSTSRIENFIGTSIGGGGSIAGSSLFAESQREIAQRQARGEIVERLFRGFPSEVLEVKVDAIRPDEINPSIYNLFVTLSYSEPWLKALDTGIKALQTDTDNPSNLKITLSWYGGGILPPGTYFSNIEKSLLHALHYCDSGGGESCSNLAFAFDILDENGVSVKYFPNQFIITKRGVGPYFYFFIKADGSSVGERNEIMIDLSKNIEIKLPVPASVFKVSAAKKIVLLPLFIQDTTDQRSFSEVRILQFDEKIVVDILSNKKTTVKDVYGELMEKAIFRARFSKD